MLEELPLWPAYALTVALFVGLGALSLLIPREQILEGAPDRARWRDIRIRAVLLVAAQLGLYWVFS